MEQSGARHRICLVRMDRTNGPGGGWVVAMQFQDVVIRCAQTSSRHVELTVVGIALAEGEQAESAEAWGRLQHTRE